MMRRWRLAVGWLSAVVFTLVFVGPVPAHGQTGVELTGTVVDASGPVATPNVDLYRYDAVAGWTYQWLRTGKPIKGATRSSYRLRTADRGHRIRIRITVRTTGYVAATRVSAATAKIRRHG